MICLKSLWSTKFEVYDLPSLKFMIYLKKHLFMQKQAFFEKKMLFLGWKFMIDVPLGGWKFMDLPPLPLFGGVEAYDLPRFVVGLCFCASFFGGCFCFLFDLCVCSCSFYCPPRFSVLFFLSLFPFEAKEGEESKKERSFDAKEGEEERKKQRRRRKK